MTTITQPQPALYWHSGGDVMMRLGPTAVRLDAQTQTEILDDLETLRRAAEVRGNSKLWNETMRWARQLTKARMDASMWSRAGRAA